MDSKRTALNHVNSVLLSACAKGLSLDLRVVGEKTPEAYRSRFLGVVKGPKRSCVVIEAPMRRGNIVPVRSGSMATVSFVHNGCDNYFTSAILARGRFQLNPETSVASLELQTPEEVLSDTKRSFYRVSVGGDEPIEIKLGIFADEEGGTNRIRWREKAAVTDIGGGGLGFKIPGGKSLLLSPGTRLTLRFRLRPEDEEIKLRGRVCFSLRQSEHREAYFGVQFIDIDSDIEFKQNVNKVLYFVAEEQRRSLGEQA